jgi:hypothetical protein
MTPEETALYEEQEKLTQALRPFIEPRPADNPATFTSEQLEYAQKVRERLREIQKQLTEIHLGNL